MENEYLLHLPFASHTIVMILRCVSHGIACIRQQITDEDSALTGMAA